MHIKFIVCSMFTDKTLKVVDVQTFDVYSDGESVVLCHINNTLQLLSILMFFCAFRAVADQ